MTQTTNPEIQQAISALAQWQAHLQQLVNQAQAQQNAPAGPQAAGPTPNQDPTSQPAMFLPVQQGQPLPAQAQPQGQAVPGQAGNAVTFPMNPGEPGNSIPPAQPQAVAQPPNQAAGLPLQPQGVNTQQGANPNPQPPNIQPQAQAQGQPQVNPYPATPQQAQQQSALPAMPPVTQGAHITSIEQVAGMTSEQINANWQQISGLIDATPVN